MDAWDIPPSIFSFLVQVGRLANTVESNYLHISPWLRFTSDFGGDEMKVLEAILLLTAVYYALLAFPFIEVMQAYYTESKMGWKEIYANSFQLALCFLSSTWITLIFVSPPCPTDESFFQVNFVQGRLLATAEGYCITMECMQNL
jgi:hypothetical protein